MIDWHSHIRPGIDDGSQNEEESLSMLRSLGDQGVECVIATPHFYANDESVEEFLARRNESISRLQKKMNGDCPRVVCGAEVRYYPGIGKMSELDKLKIGSTDLILLEMPMNKWTEYTLRELVELSSSGKLTVIMAHIERYLSFQDRSVWRRLNESGLLMQVNASFVYGCKTKRKALKLIGDGKIQFIGSDCHNMTTRSPQIGKAYDLIKKKYGEEYVAQMNEYGYQILERNKNFNL